MDFAFTDEQQMIAETAQAFFAEQARSERTRAAMEGSGIDEAMWAAFCQELGFGGVGIAECLGGAGLGLVEMAIIAEAAGRHIAAFPMLGSLAMAARALAAGGGDALRNKWLPALVAGEATAAFVFDPELRAVDDLLTGGDAFVPHGAAADLFVVAGRSGVWLVERGAAGVSVKARTSMDQTRPYARVALEAAGGVPLEDPAAATAAALQSGRIVVAAEALGGAQACLDRTTDYAKDRIQFGRPIGSFQAYKHRLADMMVEIEQCRSAVYWAACAADEQSPDTELAVHAAKSFAADAYFFCASNMIQLHGGIGFTWEHDAHLYFKRARALQSLLGTGDWHREQAAALILGSKA